MKRLILILSAYWVYMSGGSKELHVKHPNFVPLVINSALNY